jgi:hypothetical protein
VHQPAQYAAHSAPGLQGAFRLRVNHLVDVAGQPVLLRLHTVWSCALQVAVSRSQMLGAVAEKRCLEDIEPVQALGLYATEG